MKFTTCILIQLQLVVTSAACRKEIRDLAQDGGLYSFIKAFQELSIDGTLKRLVEIHGEYWDYAHFNPKFLFWHRAFIHDFEQELQKKNVSYLPYWDWTIDSQNPFDSMLFTNNYFGSVNELHQVNTSLFGFFKTPIGDNEYLVRDYNTSNSNVFYHKTILQNLLEKDSLFSKWSVDIEYGAHAIVHSLIGGKTGDMSKWFAPNDPLFWLHHSFIDKLYFEYQAKYGNAFDGNAYNVFNTSDLHVLKPWNKSIREIGTIELCFIETSEIVQLLNTETSIKLPSFPTNWGSNNSIALQVQQELKEFYFETSSSFKHKIFFTLLIFFIIV